MRIRRRQPVRLLALLACLAALLVMASPAAAETVLITREFTTPGQSEFVVPAGVTSVDITATGASGSPGGKGTIVSGTLPVTPGQTLYPQVDIGGGAPNGGGFASVSLCSSVAPNPGETALCGAEYSNVPWYVAQPIVAAGGGGAGGSGEGIGSSSHGGAGGLLGAAGEGGSSAGVTGGNGAGAGLTAACTEGGEGFDGGGDGTGPLSVPFRGIGGTGGSGSSHSGGGGGGGFLGGCGGGGSNDFLHAGGGGGGGASFVNHPGLTDYFAAIPTVEPYASIVATTSSGGSVVIRFDDANVPEPVVTSPANIQVGARPTFTGVVSHESDDALSFTLVVEQTGGAKGTPYHASLSSTAQPNGSFELASLVSLPTGTYTAAVEQSLTGGGNRHLGLARTFTVNAAPPAIFLTTPPGGSYVRAAPTIYGGIAGTEPKDSPTVVLTILNADDFEHPLATLEGAAGAGGAFSLPFSGALPDGEYVAVAEQSDNGRGHGESPTYFTVDSIAPSISLTSPAPGSSVVGVPPYRGTAGTANGDLQTVTVDLYGGTSATGVPIQHETTTPAADGSFSVPAITAPDPGTYTALATQLDQAGNEGRSAVTFTVPGPAAASPSPSPPGESHQRTPAPAPTQPSIAILGSPKGAGGVVHLALECRGASGSCSLTIAGTTAEKPSGKKVAVVRAHATIPAGKRRSLALQLDGHGRRLLRELGRLRVTLRLTEASGGAPSTRTVVVRSGGKP